MVTYMHLAILAYIGAKVLLLDGCLGKVPRAPILVTSLDGHVRRFYWMVKCVKILQYRVMVKLDYGDQG